MNRRQLLQGAFAGALLAAIDRKCLSALDRVSDALAGGKQVGHVEFSDEANVPMGKAFGAELDGRMYTDLSTLTPAQTLTPTEDFYLRTRASELLVPEDVATIPVDGLVQRRTVLKSEDLIRSAKPMGAHLMECAGNLRVIRFGLMSAAEWSGVPLASLLDDAKPKPEATRVLVSGFDSYRTPSRSSLPGASWVFTLDDLKSSGGFLATAMNGQPLTRDHGSPIRLVVPGWYGCTCIKWVNQITLVDDSAEATSQMQEFASRTLQDSMPQLARDFQPARIDQAAMPIRVEKWKVGERTRYRVFGILWGGTQPVKTLGIRFKPEEEYVPVGSFQQKTNDPWSFWTHLWSPKQPGTHEIRLRVEEPRVKTRRLDAGYYARTLEITEV